MEVSANDLADPHEPERWYRTSDIMLLKDGAT